MSYRIRKNYFKDYFWQTPGSHQVQGGGAPTNPLDRYDNKTYWYDLFNAGSPWRWYIAQLWDSTKAYSTTGNEYLPLGYTNKMGLYIYTGAQEMGADHIQAVESSYEVPPAAPVRPGFNGQYGKNKAVHYTGTIYEMSVSCHKDKTIPGPPDPYYIGPHGMSIYADVGAAPTSNTDGLHIIFIPEDSFLTIKDSAGAWTTISGDAVAVATGQLSDEANLVLIDYFTEYHDGTDFTYDPDDEYFTRIEYWPEKETFKRMELDDVVTPNLDRRLRIWFSDDKKRLKFVGEVEAIEYEYTSARDYIMLFAYDGFYDYDDTEAWVAYIDGHVGFDEVVVASEWLPFDEGTVFQNRGDELSYAQIVYAKESEELTHDSTSTSFTVPNWLQRDQLEVWSVCTKWLAVENWLYSTDFNVAFPDGWTTIDVNGLQAQESPFTIYKDYFDNEYTDKTNDPDWSGTAATWDTDTTAGALTNTGAGDIISDDIDCTQDFVFSSNFDFTGDAANLVSIKFGYNVAAVVNSSLVLSLRASDNRILLEERQGGGWVTLDTTSAYDPEGEHYLEVVRLGTNVKVYLDNVLILSGTAITVVCTNDNFLVTTAGTTVMELGEVLFHTPFPHGYCYRYNTGVTTAVDGAVHRSIVTTQDSGVAEFTMWEAFNEGSANAWAGVKLHYDNGIGNNFMAVGITYDGSDKKLYLYDINTNSIEVDFPTQTKTLYNGYYEWKFRLKWTVSGGNITGVELYSATDGEFLGEITGVTHAYAGNMRAELEFFTANGTETPYYGNFHFAETPDSLTEQIETPVFHGQVNKIVPRDDLGGIVVAAMDMSYPLWKRSSYNSGAGTFDTESLATDEALIKDTLVVDGDPDWRWFHYWNFDISDLPGTWIPYRTRGSSMFETFFGVMDYSSMSFMVTPEMQFVFDNYYRDFIASDILELDITAPEGIYYDSSTLANKSKTETNWIDGIQRIDDATVGKRIQDANSLPVDKQWIADGGDQIWDSDTTTHEVPELVAKTAGVRTGNLATLEGASLPDMVMSTLGGDDAADGNVTNMMNSWLDSILSSNSHNNQSFKITLKSSKQWYRPMDIIECRLFPINPDLVTVTSDVTDKYRYVIQRAKHVLHDDRVVYTVGRIERDNEEGEVVVDGYGTASGKRDGLGKVAKGVKNSTHQLIQ